MSDKPLTEKIIEFEPGFSRRECKIDGDYSTAWGVCVNQWMDNGLPTNNNALIHIQYMIDFGLPGGIELAKQAIEDIKKGIEVAEKWLKEGEDHEAK